MQGVSGGQWENGVSCLWNLNWAGFNLIAVARSQSHRARQTASTTRHRINNRHSRINITITRAWRTVREALRITAIISSVLIHIRITVSRCPRRLTCSRQCLVMATPMVIINHIMVVEIIHTEIMDLVNNKHTFILTFNPINSLPVSITLISFIYLFNCLETIQKPKLIESWKPWMSYTNGTYWIRLEFNTD